MDEFLRFFMDEHVPAAVTLGLRRHGIDVLTVQEAGRGGHTDEDQLAFALAEERVMVSFDPDFLVLHQSGVAHAGIAWCPEKKYGIGQLIRALLLLHGVLTRNSMRGHVEFL